MLDVAVHPAHHVALERREHRLAVALEDQRARLVQPVDVRLAEAPAECPADEPLELHPTGLSHGQEVRKAGMRLVGADTGLLQLGHAQEAPVTCGECAFEAFPPLPRVLLGYARDIGGDIALRVAQAHHQEDRRSRRPDVLQAAPVFLDVACPCPCACRADRRTRGPSSSAPTSRVYRSRSQRLPTRRI